MGVLYRSKFEGPEGGIDPNFQLWNNQKSQIDKLPILMYLEIPILIYFFIAKSQS